MKKITFLLIFILLVVITTLAQTPNGFTYQAVIRNAEGEPLKEQEVSLRISLQNEDGTSLYFVETHSTTTNPYGHNLLPLRCVLHCAADNEGRIAERRNAAGLAVCGGRGLLRRAAIHHHTGIVHGPTGHSLGVLQGGGDMRKLWLSVLLPLLIVGLLATPVLAMYYAYIYIEESDGNSYTDLPLMVTANVTQLVAGQYISSTGLDTRVLTGDGYAQTHMLADDKILFVTDLEAYENKTLIFYTDAASLSAFPIIVGQGGNITTPDHANLEPDWVFEFLASGYFDSAAGSDKNILYK
ncbi:MAG: hypothetical protein R6U65_09660, partial [Perlabentimonas sp.]